MTSGSLCTSAGVPSAILRPKFTTVMVSEMFITRPMSCSTSKTVSLNRSRTFRRSSANACVSEVLSPDAGSSRRSSSGSRARARALHVHEAEEFHELLGLVADQALLPVDEWEGEAFREDTGPHVAVPCDQDVVERAHAAEELDVLEGARDPEAGDLIGPELRDVAVAKVDDPARRPVEAGDAVEDGGLARAVGADQPVDLAHVDAEGDTIDRAQAPEVDRQLVEGEVNHEGRLTPITLPPDPSLARADGSNPRRCESRPAPTSGLPGQMDGQ